MIYLLGSALHARVNEITCNCYMHAGLQSASLNHTVAQLRRQLLITSERWQPIRPKLQCTTDGSTSGISCLAATTRHVRECTHRGATSSTSRGPHTPCLAHWQFAWHAIAPTCMPGASSSTISCGGCPHCCICGASRFEGQAAWLSHCLRPCMPIHSAVHVMQPTLPRGTAAEAPPA